MLGAIIGDIIGSTFENENHRSPFFELFPKQSRFTDDTVTLISIIDSLFKYYPPKSEGLEDRMQMEIAISDNLRLWSCCYFKRGFGSMMQQWITNGLNYSYDSPGKASLTRLSGLPLYAINYGLSKEKLLELTILIVEITHRNKQAVNTGKAYVSILYDLLKFKQNNNKITKEDAIIIILSTLHSYNIPAPKEIPEYRVDLTFNLNSEHVLLVACAAIIDENSNSFIDVMHQAVSAGGCSDTICSISGAMAEIIFGINQEEKDKSQKYFNHFDNDILLLLDKLYLKNTN